MLTDVTEAETLAGNGNPLDALIGFYRAFNARDFEELVANWAEGDLPSMDNPISGIRRGWAAAREGYSELFNGPASVRVSFHDFTSQGDSDWHLFVWCERGICKTAAVSLDLRIPTLIDEDERRMAAASSARIDRGADAAGRLPACELRRAARQTGIADQAIMELSLYRGAQSHA
jgi:hypothetical protein